MKALLGLAMVLCGNMAMGKYSLASWSFLSSTCSEVKYSHVS